MREIPPENLLAPGDAGLLTGSEVAELFGVSRGTVSNWGTAGRLVSSRTPGGARRYFAAEVTARLRGVPPERARELGLAARARLLQGAGRLPWSLTTTSLPPAVPRGNREASRTVRPAVSTASRFLNGGSGTRRSGGRRRNGPCSWCCTTRPGWYGRA